MHTTVLLLLCELTAPAAIYSLDNKYLLHNGDRLLQHHIKQLPDNIDDKIFGYYRSKLRSECWKRQLGAVHGFMRYLEVLAMPSILSLTEYLIDKTAIFHSFVTVNIVNRAIPCVLP